MKVNLFTVKPFLRFLELVGMSGEAEIKECILNFDKDKIMFEAITSLENVAIRGAYLTGNIENYELLGKFGIDNLADLRKYLGSFASEKVGITKKDNYLLLSGGKKRIKVQLRDAEYIPKVEEGKVDKLIKLGKKNIIALDKDVVGKIRNNFTLLQSKEFNLKLDKGKLAYSATSWTQHKINEDLLTGVKSGLDQIEVILTKSFVDVIGVISDDLKLGLNENAPVYISYKDEDIDVEWAIAPVIAEEK